MENTRGRAIKYHLPNCRSRPGRAFVVNDRIIVVVIISMIVVVVVVVGGVVVVVVVDSMAVTAGINITAIVVSITQSTAVTPSCLTRPHLHL